MKLNNYHIPTAAYFIIAALFIAYFFPREGKFRYQFYEGKPWKYGLLTAPSDFPIPLGSGTTTIYPCFTYS